MSEIPYIPHPIPLPMTQDIKLSSCLLVAAPERPELGVRVVLGDAGLAALMDMDESRLSYLR